MKIWGVEPLVLKLLGLLGSEPTGLPVGESTGLVVSRDRPPLRGQSCKSRSSCLELKEALAFNKTGITPLRGCGIQFSDGFGRKDVQVTTKKKNQKTKEKLWFRVSLMIEKSCPECDGLGILMSAQIL